MIKIQKRNVVVFANPNTKATTVKHSSVARNVSVVRLIFGHSMGVTLIVMKDVEGSTPHAVISPITAPHPRVQSWPSETYKVSRL